MALAPERKTVDVTDLDKAFCNWLEDRAAKWNWSAELTTTQLGRTEIANRHSLYPAISTYLRDAVVNWTAVFDGLRKCWALGGQFDAIRFNAFIAHKGMAADAIHRLMDEVTEDSGVAIDRFVEAAGKLGYAKPTGAPDRPGAALLASVVLSCYMPNRFVDYRRSRWEYFAKRLNYCRPESKATTGEWVVWAGKFASEITRTKTYQDQWTTDQNLWTIAGICWDAQRPNPPLPDPPDPAAAPAFAEGAEKYRMHLIRERNGSLVQTAKELRKEFDPGLHCEVCGFSYVEKYGERGEGFIEAHHKVPISKLTRKTKTKIEDLALLCASCHRMIHREPLMSVEQLRESLQK